MRDCNKLFKAGNAAQLEKLKENGNKNSWDGLPIGYLRNRLHDEMDELWEEIVKNPRDYQAIRHEAADMANFAHMIILQCDNILNEKAD